MPKKPPAFNLYDSALEIINQNEYVYNDNENAVAEYMKKRWDAAFVCVMEMNATDSIPSVGEAADMGSEHIDDPQRFLDDLRFVIRGLSRGGQIRDGEFRA